MALLVKTSFGQQIVAGRSARRSTIQPRDSVRASAAEPASRPLWFPGTSLWTITATQKDAALSDVKCLEHLFNFSSRQSCP
jgi:hypothetical protein